METIDWSMEEERASALTAEQIRGALADILETLPFADAMDRANGTDNGGRYRDQASVYRMELKKRGISQ